VSPVADVLITGAEGYVGRLLTERLSETLDVVATDIRLPKKAVAGVTHRVLDITDRDAVAKLVAEHAPATVVHLAAVVTPRPDQDREAQRRVDVDGTRNVLDACLAAGTAKFVYTSSGAAYGYHPDNACLLTEDDDLRGNEVFAYAAHKREVEEILAQYRAEHPELGQLIFRVSTILGERVHNQITAIFERPVVVGLRGVDTPFCFIWDEDVVACLASGVARPEKVGIYNLTGDGVMTLREIAAGMGRRFVGLPKRVVSKGLAFLSARNLSPYGPEQVIFLEHRPVLSNAALKEEFGYRPTHSSREVFSLYRAGRAAEARA
jgi:nucleoside-diphosphate-sugar epimerase